MANDLMKWSEMSVDDKLNSLNAQMQVMSKMIEDTLIAVTPISQQNVDHNKILRNYRDKVSNIMKEKGMDQGAINIFNDMLNINLND